MSTASATDLRPKADKDEAERFLCTLDPDATFFSFQVFDDEKARDDKRLAQIIHGSLSSCWDRLARFNDEGAGIFVTINATDRKGRKIPNILGIRAVFVDLDGSPLEPILQWREPQIVVESSQGRWHAYWLIADAERAQFADLQKALAAKFDGDPSVFDLPRVMRLPGFVHRKGEPFLSHLISTTEHAPYTVAELFPEGVPTTDAAPCEPPSSDDDSYWAELNSEALKNLDAWVPEIFPDAEPTAAGGYRVTSAALGRDLEEDLSLSPKGIKDFGIHDMGDRREGRRSPIDIVMEYGDKDFSAATAWLQEKLPSAKDVAHGAELVRQCLAAYAAKRAKAAAPEEQEEKFD